MGHRKKPRVPLQPPKVEIPLVVYNPPTETSYDLVIITDVDEVLFFHSCELILELLSLIGKKVYLINKQRNSQYESQLRDAVPKTKRILLYRTHSIPPITRQYGAVVGYLIDDNIFYEENSLIGKVIKSVDYCLANNETLTSALKELNPKSYCVGTTIFWEEMFFKRNIFRGEPNNSDGVRIGITYGYAHRSGIQEVIQRLSWALSGLPVTLVYFASGPLTGTNLEHHNYVSGPHGWYQQLFSLKLDLCYVEYPDSLIIRSKSNLKFREAAFMKLPLVAYDPTGLIYKKDIMNNVNGFTTTNPVEALSYLQKLVQNKTKIKKMGEAAYKTSIKETPVEVASRIWSMIK